MLRKLKAGIDPAPSVFLAGIMSIATMLPFIFADATSMRDIAILMAMGAVQLGCGCLLLGDA
jgi:hypothetical protein